MIKVIGLEGDKGEDLLYAFFRPSDVDLFLSWRISKMIDVVYLKPKNRVNTRDVLQKLCAVVEAAQEVNGILNNCELDFQETNGLVAINLYGGSEEDYDTLLDVLQDNFSEVDVLELMEEN